MPTDQRERTYRIEFVGGPSDGEESVVVCWGGARLPREYDAPRGRYVRTYPRTKSGRLAYGWVPDA